LLADRGRDRVDADRPAVELVDDRLEHLAVDLVQAELVDLEQAERGPRDVERDLALGAHLGEVADPLEDAVGDPGRPARAPGDLAGGLVLDLDPEDARRAADDVLERLDGLEVEPEGRPEAVA